MQNITREGVLFECASLEVPWSFSRCVCIWRVSSRHFKLKGPVQQEPLDLDSKREKYPGALLCSVPSM